MSYNSLPSDSTARLQEIFNAAQSGQLQAETAGRGVFAFNPYYFNHYTNRDLTVVRNLLNNILPTLQDQYKEGTKKIALYDLVKAIYSDPDSYSALDSVTLRETMVAADTLRLVNATENDTNTIYSLTKSGLEAESVWLYDPKHAFGCLGGLAIGTTAALSATKFGAINSGILPFMVEFGTFTILGTGASKSVAAMNVARKAHKAYLRHEEEVK